MVRYTRLALLLCVLSAAPAGAQIVTDHQKISALEGGFGTRLKDQDLFGSAVAAVSDIDGDGVTDLVVGADGDDDGGPNQGAIWVLFMNLDGTVKSLQKISSAAGNFTGHLDVNDSFGTSVVDLGDIDADPETVTALAVGASFNDDGCLDVFLDCNRGAVWLLSLRPDGTVKRRQKISDTADSFTGELDDDDQFGASVALLPDINGDGVRDLAVGASRDNDRPRDAGAVWILFLNEAPVFAGTATVETPAPMPGQEIAVSARVNDNSGDPRVEIVFRGGADLEFLSKDMAQQGDASYRATIPASIVSNRGIEYFITATDDAGAETRLPVDGVFSISITVPDPGIFTRDIHPGGTEQNAYRLLSLPLNLDADAPRTVLEDDFGAYDDTRWRFYDLQPDLSLTELPGLSALTPGKAYYVISKDPVDLLDTGAGTSVPTDQPFAIPLEPGWHLIGNPFTFNIPVSNLRLKSTGQAPDLRTLDGAWSNFAGTEIAPFDGYAISATTRDTLFIDPDLSTIDTTQVASAKRATDEPAWSIRILAQSQQARDTDTRAAVFENAHDRWDRLDRPEPPPIGDYVSVYFTHPEWRQTFSRYSTDARSIPQDGAVWPFEVTTTVRDKVHLTFDGLDEVPADYEVWLVDEVVQTRQNLRQAPSYTVAATTDPHGLKLVVGKAGFVEDELAAGLEIPTTYELFPNFPNPFNPSTTIRYGLPEASAVTLEIYNLLGQRVATLALGEERSAGYHAEVWDGRSDGGAVVASGVYFARLRAGRFVQTQKMVLVK